MTDTGILVTLALALVAATIGGAIAVRLGQSPILGYVVAGVIIGPYTAGPVAQPETVAALADDPYRSRCILRNSTRSNRLVWSGRGTKRL